MFATRRPSSPSSTGCGDSIGQSPAPGAVRVITGSCFAAGRFFTAGSPRPGRCTSTRSRPPWPGRSTWWPSRPSTSKAWPTANATSGGAWPTHPSGTAPPARLQDHRPGACPRGPRPVLPLIEDLLRLREGKSHAAPRRADFPMRPLRPCRRPRRQRRPHDRQRSPTAPQRQQDQQNQQSVAGLRPETQNADRRRRKTCAAQADLAAVG